MLTDWYEEDKRPFNSRVSSSRVRFTQGRNAPPELRQELMPISPSKECWELLCPSCGAEDKGRAVFAPGTCARARKGDPDSVSVCCR